MAKGRILKGIGGFYYVKTDDLVIECKPRGLFRKDGHTPTVGDVVEVEGNTLVTIYPRKNILVRPPVANVDCVILVISVSVPVPNLFLVDKLLTVLENLGLEIVICLNKCDTAIGNEIKELLETYERAGYPIFVTSSLTGEGIKSLKGVLSQGTTCFAGVSGVGKSSLLNAVNEYFHLDSGEVSQKIGRGKHTTRHVELLPFEDGFVVDTPGFSNFEVTDINHTDLESLFPEFRAYREACRFRGCSHTAEPQCAVLEAVENGEIPLTRHQSYVMIYHELKNVKAWKK